MDINCDNIKKKPNDKVIKKDSKKTKKKKKKCQNCKKRLGLIPFECKCKNQFCIKCRYPDKHNCNFDWVLYGKEKILKENPLITVNKINKIE